MSLNDLDVFHKAGKPLTSPRPMRSRLELSRHVRLTDDQITRAVQRLEAYLGKTLIDFGNPVSLTATGRKLLPLVDKISLLSNDAEQTAEPLTIQADSDIAAVFLPEVLPNFWKMWGSVVALRVFPLYSSVRKHIADGDTSHGWAWAEAGETIPAAEIVGPALPWTLVVPDFHPLSDFQGEVSPDQLGADDHVFLSSVAANSVGLEKFLAGVPRSNQLQVESVWNMLRNGLGLGLMPDLFGSEPCEGFTKLTIKDADPMMQLRLFLPRSGAGSLSEPAAGLCQAMRHVCEARFAPKQADTAKAPHANGSVAEIPSALPFEDLEVIES
jgi:DNA-binding transcriptional LysR family regulator